MEKAQKEYTKTVKKRNMASNVLLAISVMLGILPSIIIVLMVGALTKGDLTMAQIILGAAGMAASLALKALFYGLSTWKAHESAYGVLTDIRIDMISHLKKLPLGFFQTKKAGDLTGIINHDVEQVEVYLAHALPEIMSATLIPVTIFVAMLVIDWRLALALICTVPVVLLMRKGLNKVWAGSSKRYSDSTKKMSEDLLEYIATIPVIKAFSREEQKTRKVLDGMHDYIRWVKKALTSISVPMGFIAMMLEGGLVVMVIVGSTLLQTGQIDLQRFVLALILGGVFTASFGKLATLQHYGIVFKQAMSRIGSVMGVQSHTGRNRYKSVSPGDIVFKDVCFSYNGNDKILSDVNLTFKTNTVNAIIGASGCGKTTIANLIMGFWPTDSGKIAINGKDIGEMSEEALSSLVSIVQQEIFLFNLSIEENIRIGRQGASRKEIIEAAKRAQIHDFIMSLPQGYGTMAGEAGVKFSGGEKQRISIARMILKDTPIVILDEATAAIDPNNEYLIQKAISNLGENKTIITIAHHMNTIRSSDQIVVMDEGKVAAFGQHEELLKSCRLYEQMTEEQNKVDNWQIKEASA